MSRRERALTAQDLDLLSCPESWRLGYSLLLRAAKDGVVSSRALAPLTARQARNCIAYLVERGALTPLPRPNRTLHKTFLLNVADRPPDIEPFLELYRVARRHTPGLRTGSTRMAERELSKRLQAGDTYEALLEGVELYLSQLAEPGPSRPAVAYLAQALSGKLWEQAEEAPTVPELKTVAQWEAVRRCADRAGTRLAALEDWHALPAAQQLTIITEVRNYGHAI